MFVSSHDLDIQHRMSFFFCWIVWCERWLFVVFMLVVLLIITV